MDYKALTNNVLTFILVDVPLIICVLGIILGCTGVVHF